MKRLDPKNLRFWLPTYMINKIKRLLRPVEVIYPIHIIFCFVDHFEPFWREADEIAAVKRVKMWEKVYPQLARRHRDWTGVPLQHTFFYPIEEYDQEILEKLASLCKLGVGEVEIHYHHNHDTSDNLRNSLNRFKEILWDTHNLLSRHVNSDEVMYGFIHGNWALDNSRSDGKWCGVNNEITILRETGCYADFTLPSAPSDTQTRKINSIYYATDDPLLPKSHDWGSDVRVGACEKGDLMIIQGPLCLDMGMWKKIRKPRIENGEISWDNPPSPRRWNLWLSQWIHVIGKPNWIFIKVHTHGAQDRNFEVVLGEPMDLFLEHVEKEFNDGEKYCLHYVTAREMYNIIKAAEQGCGPDPTKYRDFLLKKRE